MTTKNKAFIYSAVLCLSIACTDQLEVEPTSVITNASFWKSPDDAQGALVGMYVDLRDVAATSLYYLGEARADVVTLGTVGEGGWAKYYLNTLNSADAGPSWQQFYTLVNSANLILKYVPGISFPSESEKNDILAQAYTMRAFAYFVMVRSWGALPIRTEPLEGSDAESTQKERSSVEEVFSLIKSDLDQAIALYPDNTFDDGRHMWSKPGANALKANVYLWTGKRLNGGDPDFTTALEALNEVQTADVALLPDFSDVFDYENKGNQEIVMAVRFEEFEAPINYFKDMYIIGSAIPSDIDQATRDLIGPVGAGNNIVVPTESLKAQYTDDDTRKEATFYEIYRYPNGNPTYFTTIVQKGVGTVSGGARLFLSDVILYRYADVLLMKAEAKNALGQDPSAEINMVRERAYGANAGDYVFVSGTKDENDEAILRERLLELAFEGKRWWDLIRFGKAIEMLPSLQGRENPEQLLLFPISNTVLSLEPTIEQNPGY